MEKKHWLARHFYNGTELLSDQVISVFDNRIEAICPLSEHSDKTIHETVSGIVSPGLVDLQVNGGGGVMFNDEPTLEQLLTIVNSHHSMGTHYLLPTVITDCTEVMEQAANSISTAIKENIPGVIGIHFEGPHISLPKKGVHPAEHVRGLSDRERRLYARSDIGIKLITLAPESVSDADVKYLLEQGCIVSIGHTNGDYATQCKAIELGANGFTHLYNAMSALNGRAPGAVGAALNHADVYAGIIVDGFHVDYAAVELAWKMKNTQRNDGEGRLFLVSDAMASIGSELTEFDLFAQKVTVQSGRLTNETGTLAGAHLSMAMALANTYQHLPVNQLEALKMATLYPSRFIKQTQLGQLQVGQPFVAIELDEQLNFIRNLN